MVGRGIRMAIVVVATTVLASCGEKSEPSAAPRRSTTTTVAVTTTTLAYRTEKGAATPPDAVAVSMRDYKFDPSTVRSGSTTLRLALTNDETPCAESSCDADLVHDFVILNSATGLPLARSDKLSPGESGVFVVEGIPAGTYRFFCSIHVMASMEGTLEVAA